MKTDRYKKVNDKWWFDMQENKWIHNNNIEYHLFPSLPKGGTQLPKRFKNTRNKKFY